MAALRLSLRYSDDPHWADKLSHEDLTDVLALSHIEADEARRARKAGA